jgi:capsular polysaccharide biosynthesis protein
LLAKKQQSVMATDLEKRQQGEQFKVLDPPSLPLKPYFPDRFKMSLAGLGAGIALALGLVVLFEFANAPIYHDDDLRDLTSAPLLVAIPSIFTPAEERARSRQHWLEVTAASLLLACMPVVTLLAYLKG